MPDECGVAANLRGIATESQKLSASSGGTAAVSKFVNLAIDNGLHRQAPINLNDLPGDIPSILRQEETRDAGNFIGFGKTRQRNLF